MAIEQGLVTMIQTGLNNSAIQGGFLVQLPANFITPDNTMAWTYRSIISTPLYSLNGQNSFTRLEVQIDCHGYKMSDAITLARQIQSLLSGGWSGTLADSDSTVVQGIFQLPSFTDGYDPNNKTFVRSLEYLIEFYQT